uniref:Uncharacterized protein n=1 Tax=Glossina morsitans morsitans TaxID=37546 RepID=A0A1B0G5U3_GLOMM
MPKTALLKSSIKTPQGTGTILVIELLEEWVEDLAFTTEELLQNSASSSERSSIPSKQKLQINNFLK